MDNGGNVGGDEDDDDADGTGSISKKKKGPVGSSKKRDYGRANKKKTVS